MVRVFACTFSEFRIPNIQDEGYPGEVSRSHEKVPGGAGHGFVHRHLARG